MRNLMMGDGRARWVVRKVEGEIGCAPRRRRDAALYDASRGMIAMVLVWMFTVGARGAEGTFDIRRDATVAAVEGAMPSVVNISAKTVVRRGGYFYDWWRDNWAPFY